MADLQEGEFDFSQPPPLGGPLGGEFEVDVTDLDLSGELGRFEAHLSDREQQLAILEPMLLLLVGGFVLLITLSVLLPVFSLSSSIAR